MRTHLRLARSVAIVAATLPIVAGSGVAAASAAGGPSPEQRFVPGVVGAYNGLSRRPDALGFGLGTSPAGTSCKHYQGIARRGFAGEARFRGHRH